MAEKAAVAWLAGVPVLAKPGTPTAPLAVRIVELWVEADLLPEGAMSLLTGSAGDLLDHVGPQDCVAFTGGSETARAIGRTRPSCATTSGSTSRRTRSTPRSSARTRRREPTPSRCSSTTSRATCCRRPAQKCTAVRRIFVPEASAESAIAALTERMSGTVVGDPADKATDVGPVSGPGQHRTVTEGLAQLDAAAKLIWRAEVPAAHADGGCFVPPSLFRSDLGAEAPYVHEHEVFGPVATVLPWPGDVETLAKAVAKGGGGLVASLYSDDLAWAGAVIGEIAPWHGRIHWGSRKVHDQSPGPGTVLPNLVHGGPGKAGGGEELGGLRGVWFYLQRTAIQGDRALLERVLD